MNPVKGDVCFHTRTRKSVRVHMVGLVDNDEGVLESMSVLKGLHNHTIAFDDYAMPTESELDSKAWDHDINWMIGTC